MTDVPFDDRDTDATPEVDETADAKAAAFAAEEARAFERERQFQRRRAEARQLDALFERNFATFAPTCARLGWAIYPQDADDKRRPSVVNYERLKWKRYQEVGPSEKEVSRWHEASKSNVAIILGRASGNVFALDIDVSDEKLAWQIEDLADEVMGVNNWRRIGNPPKRALLYRVETAEELPLWSRHVLTDESGAPSEHMIEILGQGRSITAFGRHWKTHMRFSWSTGFSPISDPPSVVPVTTQAKLAEFLDAVNDRLRPFVKKRAITTTEFDDGTERVDGDVVVPGVHLEYPIDAQGKVVDSRETYLLRLCWATVRRNVVMAMNPETMPLLHAAVKGEFLATAATVGRWHSEFLEKQIKDKCESTRGKLERGETRPITGGFKPKLAPRPVAHAAAKDGHVDIGAMLRWLPLKRMETGIALIDPPAGHDASGQAISSDPTIAVEIASDKNRLAVRRWVRKSLAHEPTSSTPAPHDLIIGPTGLGKTMTILDELAEAAKDFGEPLRIGLAMPTHQNADEVLGKAEAMRASLLDLAAEAAALAEGQAAGLRTMIYRGRTRTTADGEHVCLYRHDDALLMQAAGASAAVLCSAKRLVLDENERRVLDENGEPLIEEVDCPGRYGRNEDGSLAKRCILWRQQEQVPESDLVIFPHAYLAMDERMPEVLKDNLRAVVVDEDITGKLIKTGKMPLDRLLLRSRPEPKLSKKERQAGMQEGELELERRAAAEVVYHALSKGEDPSAALIETARTHETKLAIEKAARERRIPAMDLYLSNGLNDDEKTKLRDAVSDHVRHVLDCCIAVTGRRKRLEADINYDTPSAEIEKLVADIKQPFIRAEHLLWQTIRERVLRLLHVEATPGVEGHVATPLHRTDPRIRVCGRHVRVVGRKEMALSYKPTLFLDASAELLILRKFVPSDLRETIIDAPIRQVTIGVSNATFSKSSLLTRSDEETGRYVAKAKKLTRVRELLDALCAHHSDGRVLCICPLKVRRRLTEQGYWPHNLDHMHYNAVRGLDWARSHKAAVTIGELNARPEDIDDLVAALTYDDKVPEPMMVGPDGVAPAWQTTEVKVPLRNGGYALYPTHRYTGPMAAAVQRSIRDAELLQSWGRLRPIHRTVPGVVYHLGRTIPAGTVLDDVVSLADILTAFGAVGNVIAVGHGAATTEAVEAKESPTLEKAFTATVAAVEADADLHPGLHVVRAEDGRVALVSAVAPAQAVDAVAAAGYDVSALPQTPEPVPTEADELRRQATLDQRWSAHEAVQDLKRWVLENLRREGNQVWLPYGDDWGVDWKGNSVKPEPVSLREALEAMRGPAVEVTANDDEEEMA